MFRTSNFDKLLDKATSNLQLEPDWPAMLQICDLIRQQDVQAKTALAAIKKKLINSNPHVAYFGTLVLECCVKNCGSLIHDEIGTKPYMEQLKEIIKTSQHENVRQKLLELIQAWACAFRNNSKYRAIQDILNIMKTEGYKFPAIKESDAMFSADTAPEWEDGDVCHRCRVVFSMVQRKHHCRACGQVFCGQCSSKTSTIPKFGIEKEVRVCDSCYEQVSKPVTVTTKETDLPPEYLSSSLAQQQQVPTRKTDEELQEEEELELALALSQSEAEQKEKEKKRATSAFKSNSISVAKTTYSPPPSPGPSPSKLKEEPMKNLEIARYMNRKYWDQRHQAMEESMSRSEIASPSAPNIGSPVPQKMIVVKQENGEVDTEVEEFVKTLRSQVDIFVNRMKSNTSRGRNPANDSSVQTLFMNTTDMHSQLLRFIQEQDDKRVYYEGLQDKLTQIKDARAALDALREEHREKLQREAEEAERKRQLQMAQKLEIMRKKKEEYLQYQRQLALQRIQEQEREMQMRQEQQKQQYVMGGYQAVPPGYMGTSSQGSPVRQVQYQTPGTNYHVAPMSPTSQGVYIPQYPVTSYGMPPSQQPPTMTSMPPHMSVASGPHLGQIPKQESVPTDQVRESLGRVSISGPGMVQQLPGGPALGQMQQHQQQQQPQQPQQQQPQPPPAGGIPGGPNHIPGSTQGPPNQMLTQQRPTASVQMGMPQMRPPMQFQSGPVPIGLQQQHQQHPQHQQQPQQQQQPQPPSAGGIPGGPNHIPGSTQGPPNQMLTQQRPTASIQIGMPQMRPPMQFQPGPVPIGLQHQHQQDQQQQQQQHPPVSMQHGTSVQIGPQQHVTTTAIPALPGTIQIPVGSGTGTGGQQLPTMAMQFPSQTQPQTKEEPKPDTAELISFD